MENEKYQIVRETNLTGKNLYEQSLLNAEQGVNTLDMLADQLKTINKVKVHLGKIDFGGNDVLASLYELISIFSAITIARMDLSVIVPNLFIVTNTATSQFFIKQGYLILCEGVGAYDRKVKNFKCLIDKAGEPYKSEFVELSNLLKDFKKDGRQEEIVKIRNKIAGHIDNNFLIWYDHVSKLDAEKLGQSIVLFMKFSHKLIEMCYGLLAHFKQVQHEETEASLKRITDQLDQIDEITNMHNQKFPDKHFDFDTNEFREFLKSKVQK